MIVAKSLLQLNDGGSIKRRSQRRGGSASLSSLASLTETMNWGLASLLKKKT